MTCSEACSSLIEKGQTFTPAQIKEIMLAESDRSR